MVQQVTHNIKVSVEAKFEGAFYNDHKKRFAFSYSVTIENQSQHPVKLKSRYWIIKDALNQTETVEGKGVIGEQPLIPPGKNHHYNSGCILVSPFGSMEGYYQMENSFQEFKVMIPHFILSVPFAMN